MPAGKPPHFSLTEAGVLMREYEARLRDVVKVEFGADEISEGDVLAARHLAKKARLALLVGIQRLQKDVRFLQFEKNRLIKEKSRLNVENRALADMAIAEREQRNQGA